MATAPPPSTWHIREMEPLVLSVDSHHISPYAMACFVALEEKQLPYTMRAVSLPQGEQRTAGFPGRTHRVPLLQHGDYVLAESQAITEYLAETFPFPDHPRIFPADLRQRGICREIMGWVRSDLAAIRQERSTETIWYARPVEPLSDDGKAAAGKLVAYCDSLLDGSRPTLFDAWCIADADLAMMLRRLRKHDALPAKLAAYTDANWARPSLQKWDALVRPPYVAY